MASILVSVPNTGSIKPEIANMLLIIASDMRHDKKIIYPQIRPFQNSLNHTRNKFLEGNYDYWLSIDSDNPPTKNPLDLIDFKKDVIACPTPQWNDIDDYPIYFVVMDAVDDGWREHKIKVGLQEVDAVGFGCVIFSRRIIEKIKFEREWNDDGTQATGIDFVFCKNAKQLGFKIFAHYDYVCSHYKELNLLDVLKFKHHGT